MCFLNEEAYAIRPAHQYKNYGKSGILIGFSMNLLGGNQANLAPSYIPYKK